MLAAHTELNHLNQEEPIKRMENGDIEAFNPLIRKYKPRIYNLVSH